jgi:hypothetical protein
LCPYAKDTFREKDFFYSKASNIRFYLYAHAFWISFFVGLEPKVTIYNCGNVMDEIPPNISFKRISTSDK